MSPSTVPALQQNKQWDYVIYYPTLNVTTKIVAKTLSYNKHQLNEHMIKLPN